MFNIQSRKKNQRHDVAQVTKICAPVKTQTRDGVLYDSPIRLLKNRWALENGCCRFHQIDDSPRFNVECVIIDRAD